MPAIPFPVSSSPGQENQEGAGRLRNCYAEKTEPGARFPVKWPRVPGLQQIHEIASHIHLRGGITVAGTFIAVMDNRVYTLTEGTGDFTSVNRGALNGTDRVTVAKNNASTPLIVCVSEAGVFNLFIDSTPTAFADSDVGSPNSVSEHHGYFLFTAGNGTITASSLNSVSVPSNSFTQDQSVGQLIRGVSYRDEWFAFGRTAAAVYVDIGASPFPLERRNIIPRGLAGTHAIAGWEDGAKDALIWAADDGTVCQLEGYRAVPISNDDVARDVAAAIAAGSGDLLEASVYKFRNNAIWSLTLPGEWTWERNITTGNWHERFSYGRDDCRLSFVARAFDRWLAGDRTTGKLFSITPDYAKEAGDPLIWEMTSGVVANFPARQRAARADFDFTAAVGTANGLSVIETDPSVAISWSLDGGYSYGNPVLRKLGAQGKSNQLVTVNRIGLVKAKGLRFKLEISDPVHIGFLGGQVAAMQASA